LKIDYKKELKHLYNASGTVSSIEVPEMGFLMIDGQGDPNTSQEYRDTIEALFTVSYAAKFTVKKETGLDYTVMPLEGLWWMDDMIQFSTERKADWKWTSMIMQPEPVTPTLIEKALEQSRKKKNLPALGKIRYEQLDEGLCAQVMYIGPFSAEGPTIARVHEYILKSGHKLSGKHHEIYLSNFQRTASEKLKTIIRQPMS